MNKILSFATLFESINIKSYLLLIWLKIGSDYPSLNPGNYIKSLLDFFWHFEIGKTSRNIVGFGGKLKMAEGF